ncbi:hypothetical protein Ancab_040623 [Ancistrocladus abbreviatus]
MAMSKAVMSCIVTFFVCLLLLKGAHLNGTKSNIMATDAKSHSYQGRKLGQIIYGALHMAIIFHVEQAPNARNWGHQLPLMLEVVRHPQGVTMASLQL